MVFPMAAQLNVGAMAYLAPLTPVVGGHVTGIEVNKSRKIRLRMRKDAVIIVNMRGTLQVVCGSTVKFVFNINVQWRRGRGGGTAMAPLKKICRIISILVGNVLVHICEF